MNAENRTFIFGLIVLILGISSGIVSLADILNGVANANDFVAIVCDSICIVYGYNKIEKTIL